MWCVKHTAVLHDDAFYQDVHRMYHQRKEVETTTSQNLYYIITFPYNTTSKHIAALLFNHMTVKVNHYNIQSIVTATSVPLI